ncbi:ABC transporter permease [Dysosmobacter sp. NSJ-60]|nr:ABC transporter permease [Dysosmobacter hominis]MBS5658368.1 ABC transporter permease [Oscillibacter sp.]
MLKFIGKRLLWLIPICLGVSLIIFAIMDLTPGNPARLLLGESATEDAVAELEEELGLNKPFFTRYLDWVSGVFTGDFGISYRTREPVFDEVMARLPRTVKLAFLTSVLSVLFSIPLGILSAVKRGSALDNVSLVVSLILTSAPAFLVGLVFILIFCLWLGWFPATGVSTWKGYVLPGIAAALNYSAALQRMMRSSMLETIRSDFIRTARAKGCKEMRVIMHHALGNAILPVITLIGINFGWQLGGTIIIEQLFSIPGLGTLLLTSVNYKDAPQVMTSCVLVAILAALINLAVDIAYAYIDPRVKAQLFGK